MTLAITWHDARGAEVVQVRRPGAEQLSTYTPAYRAIIHYGELVETLPHVTLRDVRAVIGGERYMDVALPGRGSNTHGWLATRAEVEALRELDREHQERTARLAALLQQARGVIEEDARARAARTGRPVVVQRGQAPCREPASDCSSDAVADVYYPDGHVERTYTHTY